MFRKNMAINILQKDLQLFRIFVKLINYNKLRIFIYKKVNLPEV